MNKIEKQGIFFVLSEGVLQELSLETISRKLNPAELEELKKSILYYFKDYDTWIKELIMNETGIYNYK